MLRVQFLHPPLINHQFGSNLMSNFKRFLCVVALIISNLLISVKAIEVNDLYQATVPVQNQSRQVRAIAEREALSEVIIKVSGQHEVLESAEIKNAVSNASQYLRQFEFSRDDQGQLLLHAQFDENKLNKLLRRESLPIWGKRRPAILLWMAGEDAQTLVRHVISRESYNHLREQILTVSKQRGLPILFPLYDLQDNQSVSVSDVWGHFYHHIVKFSARYDHDAIVIARFRHLDETQEQANLSADGQDMNWNLQWRLYEQDNLVKVNAIDGNLTEVLEQLVHALADNYANQYAVNSANLANASSMILTVHGVGDIKHLIAAEDLLGSFSAVADVNLHHLKGQTAQFNVTLLGEPLDLIKGMALEQQFEAVFDPLNDNKDELNTEFRWVP